MSDSPFANIIFDYPAKTDAFEGKGHERTAKALAESIMQIAEEQDGAIGLEGTWGSGKSTVIEMATEALEQQDRKHRYKVFYFDLWTHHSDEFKRAFLERFVSWCEDHGFLESREAEKQRGRIRNKVKKIDTTNQKSFSTLGALLILLLPFLPVAFAWISPVAFSREAAPAFWGFTWPEVIVRLLLLAACVPVLVILAKMLAEWVVWPFILPRWRRVFAGPDERRVSTAKWSELPHFSTLASETLSLFTRESRQDTLTQNIRDEDPTTVEFYLVFRDILAQVQTSKQRIIFVLDNVDRLPLDAIPKTWSEIRAVFATSDPRRVAGHSRVTVVVPYDRAYVMDAFPKPTALSAKRDRKISATFAKDAEAPEAAAQDTSDEFRFAEGDVFNKTFSRILKVSPPIGSHWGRYLEEVLDKAFESQHSPASRNKLFRLFQLYLQRNRIHPTPRMIIGYVNEIGAYWTQWGKNGGDPTSTIPVESMALFVLMRARVEDDPYTLTQKALVDERYLNIVDQGDDALKHLSALAFNVPLSDAIEVLLGDSIKDALVAPDAAELQRLAELPGFEKFFQHYLSTILEEYSSEDAKLVAVAASNVNSLKLSDAVSEHVWKEFARTTPKLTKILDVPESDIEGLFVLIENQPVHSAPTIAEGLRDNLKTAAHEEKSLFPDKNEGAVINVGRRWAKFIARASDALAKVCGIEVAKNFWSSSRVEDNAAFAVGVAQQCSAMANYNFRTLDGQFSMGTLQKPLDFVLRNDPAGFRDAIFEIEYLVEAPERLHWLTTVADALRGSQLPSPDADALIQSYIKIDQRSSVKSDGAAVLRDLVSDGTLIFYAHQGFSENDHNLFADALFLIVKRSGTSPVAATQHANFGSIPTAFSWYQNILLTGDFSDDVVGRLVDQVSQTGSLADWASHAAADKSEAGVFKEVVRKVATSGVSKSIDLTGLIKKYDILRSVLDDTTSKQLIEWLGAAFTHDEVKEKLSVESTFTTIGEKFVADVGAAGTDSSLSIVLQEVDLLLRDQTAEQWADLLQGDNGDREVRLLIARLKTGTIHLPANTFSDALQKHAEALLKGEVTVRMVTEDWDLLSTALSQASRKTLAGRLLAGLPRSGIPTDGAVTFIKAYRRLADLLPLAEEPDRTVGVLLRELVKSSDPAIRDFVHCRAKDFRRAMDKADKSIVDSLGDQLDGLESSGESESARVTVLRGHLGMKRK